MSLWEEEYRRGQMSERFYKQVQKEFDKLQDDIKRIEEGEKT